MIGALPVRFSALRRAAAVVFFTTLASAVSLAGQAGQSRTVTDRVYSAAQAARGEQIFKAQCVSCHGNALEGAVGPPLTGEAFLSVWSARSLAEFVDKIEKTMPPQQPGSTSRSQAVDLAAFVLRFGKFPAGET